MTSREMIFGIVGLLLGAGAGVLATKKYYQKKSIDEVNTELEKIHEAQYGTYENKAEEYKSENNEKPSVDKLSYTKHMKDEHEKTNYQAMYRAEKLAKDATDRAENDNDSEIDNDDESFEEYDRAKTKDRPPICISAEALGEVPEYYDHVELNYYAYDDILTDENDNVIEDRERFLGNCMKKFGFDENEEDQLFVQNFELSTVYEIQKFDAAFESMEEYEDE